MGGLQSMVQVGFSMVALGKFSVQAWKLGKKIGKFIIATLAMVSDKTIGKAMRLMNIQSLAQTSQLASKMNPQNAMMLVVRVLAVAALAIGLLLKHRVKEEM